MKRIKSNKVKCRNCGDVIESTHRHDFVWCGCRTIAVDGGTEYLRRIGNMDGYDDLSEMAEDCEFCQYCGDCTVCDAPHYCDKCNHCAWDCWCDKEALTKTKGGE